MLRVDYVAPTPLGPELEIRARVRDQSERKATVDVTVRAGDTVTARGEVLAVRMPATMMRG
jgi:acyl-coenzyme A thioesterase PaaI-like protein